MVAHKYPIKPWFSTSTMFCVNPGFLWDMDFTCYLTLHYTFRPKEQLSTKLNRARPRFRFSRFSYFFELALVIHFLQSSFFWKIEYAFLFSHYLEIPQFKIGWYSQFMFLISRSSRSEVFCKKSVLRNFAKLTRKHMCQASPCNFIKKETLAMVFSCEFCESFKNNFSYSTHSVAASEYQAVQTD